MNFATLQGHHFWPRAKSILAFYFGKKCAKANPDHGKKAGSHRPKKIVFLELP